MKDAKTGEEFMIHGSQLQDLSAHATGSVIDPEIVRLRERNSELQRRCQKAESAVLKFKRDWDKHGGPRGGSFGRALLACYCEDLERRLQICHADSLYIRVEWLKENGHEELAKVIENIRRQSSLNDQDGRRQSGSSTC